MVQDIVQYLVVDLLQLFYVGVILYVDDLVGLVVGYVGKVDDGIIGQFGIGYIDWVFVEMVYQGGVEIDFFYCVFDYVIYFDLVVGQEMFFGQD